MTAFLLSCLAETLSDPVLLRWRLKRLSGHFPPPPADPAGPPSYLAALPPAEAGGQRDPGFACPVAPPPTRPLTLALPGYRATLSAADSAADARDLCERRFPMAATARAFHGFQWLSLQPDIPPGWVAALWQGWMETRGRPRPEDLAWRPTVAASRVVALLDYARQVGLPAPADKTLAVLAAHGPAIAGRLGEPNKHATAVDLALQGWALYRLGLELSLEATAARGLVVLLDEAVRRTRPSGMLAEDSTAQHLRFTRAYADAWLAARRHHRPEAGRLEAALRPMLAAAAALTLPGGLPEIGEVPSDAPPSFLAGLLRGQDAGAGWTGRLPAEERQALAGLVAEEHLDDLELLRADGWLRLTQGRWHGLWHAAPGGWCRRPGAGHQDLGGFELHYGSVPVFVDPGSPPIDIDPALAALYRAAVAHNTLTLDGEGPEPLARPFYSDAFRRDVAGPPPVLQAEYDGASLAMASFGAVGGPRQSQRRWRFSDGGFAIEDVILGTGVFQIERRLITPLPIALDGGRAVVTLPGGRRLKVEAEGTPQLLDERRWTAAGAEVPLTVILFAQETHLPWRGRLTVTPVTEG